MGAIYRLTCRDCKKAYELNVGQGMFDNRIENVLGYFDDKTADLIKEKLSITESSMLWSFRRMIGSCSICKTLEEIPVFTITDEGKDYATAGKCSCGSSAVLFDYNDPKQMDEIKCPVCGGSMDVTKTGMWD